ncbi:uncharacterized protein LOC129255948 isoform X1 [Lytechinus pictus]|uniref:uncharacterized protein LOC129255948 isoform X1 n=1 Tax=Lytechinus pictus TaxID=7653 RepID=UPI0030B9D711
MLYPLFELAAQLRVCSDIDNQEQRRYQSPVLSLVQSKKPVRPARITFSSHRQIGNATVTVLVCSVDFLILRYEDHGHKPITKDLKWFQDPTKAICAITLGPTGSWAVVACSDRSLYLIPVLALLGVPSSRTGNSFWKKNDVTKIEIKANIGVPSALLWWNSLDDRFIIVMGTEKGEVMMVDLGLERDVRTVMIGEAIASMDMIRHDDNIGYLLVFTKGGNQWGMLLEQSSEVSALTTSMEMEAEILEYEVIQANSLPVRSILHAGLLAEELVQFSDGTSPGFAPVRFQQFTQNIQLTSQYARGRSLVAGHNFTANIFKIYDSSIDNWMPLYVYRIPPSSQQILLTNRLLFCVIVSEDKQVSLLVLSNQKSEVSSPDQLANKDAILQTFTFPKDETFIGMYRHNAEGTTGRRRRTASSLSHTRHRTGSGIRAGLLPDGEGEESDDDYYSTSSELAESETGFHGKLHPENDPHRTTLCTHLDGCTVITSRAVYHCRPRISPEGLFLDLALSDRDGSVAENLGITLDLDMSALYEIAAERKLAMGEVQRALNLYQISQCSYIKQVTNLAKYGRIGEILSLVTLALGRTSELSGQERKMLANIAIKCFVYEILEGDRREELMFNFKQFVLESFDYNEDAALELFASCGLHDILIEVAKARGKLSIALDLVLKTGLPQIDCCLRKQLVSQGYITKFSAAGDMSFVRCMPPQQAITHLLAKPELIFKYTEFVRSCLDDVDVKTLLKLAQLFDPSKPTLRPLLKSQRERSHSTGSISSHDSFKTAQCSTDSEDGAMFPKPSVLIEIFIIILLKLNKKRQEQGSTQSLENGHACDLAIPVCPEESSSDRLPVGLLLPAQNVVACGQDHAAIVANGDVYTWGRAHEGRLGQGDIISLDGRAPPLRVETLHMHGIHVRAVACGKEHTMAVTRDGKLYSWGSSSYGQLGVGDRNVHSRPVAVEALNGQRCLSVACGQLHTLVITQGQRLWSFGWGVHGQLGHGDVEDQILPKLVNPFSKSAIVGISAGYAHSGVLTNDGQVWMFGSSAFGQLGTGSVGKSTVPIHLEALSSRHVSILTCGYYSNIAITCNPQKVYSWGKSPLELRQALQLARKRHHARHNNPDPHHQTVSRLPSLPLENQHLLPSLVPTNIQAPIKQMTMSGNHYLMLTTVGDLYTWGSNDSGQLGMGNRVNQSVPVWINRSRDDLFVAIAAGSRFSLAVNYQNQAVAWGSAEYGKLGMETRDKMCLPSYSTSAYLDPRTGSKNTPRTFLQPTIIPGIPAIHVERESIASCDSSDESSDGEDELQDSGVLESIISSLPDLGQPDEDGPVYGKPSLSLTLTHMQTFFSSATILHQAVNTEHWWLAAELSHQTGDHISALGYSLRELETGFIKDHQSHQEKVLATVNKYLRLVLVKTPTSRFSEAIAIETGKQLLIQIFHYWYRHPHLAISELESLLLPHLDLLAQPLSSILFSVDQGARDKESSPDEADYLIPPAFLDCFSSSFCLEITNHVVTSISSSQPTLANLDQVLSTFIPVQTSSNQLRLDAAAAASSSYGSVPAEKLWQEILFNLRKDVMSQSYIRLSGKDLAALVPGGVGSKVSLDCVVFTCGHHYQRQDLKRQVMSTWGTDMEALPVPLPITQKALQSMYTEEGDKTLPGACPRCIHSAILAYQKE